MKRAWYLAAVVTLALVVPAMGQIRGAPASVTSMAPGRSYNPGPPASVTSLGPYGYSTPFTGGFFLPDGRRHAPINLGSHRHRRANTGAYYPVYVPYAYPVAAGPDPEEMAEPDPPAPTIFEHRSATALAPYSDSRYGTHYLDDRDQPSTAAQPSPAEARQVIPVVLIYRDGHQQEVSNYAIVGQTLYDLGTFVAHKIPLADLDLKATIKANDDRGVEFALPASVKMD